MTSISRRHFLSVGALAAGSSALLDPMAAWAWAEPRPPIRPILFNGIGPGRGDPAPHSLKGDDLANARLTPETWRLEIIGDGSTIEKPRTIADDTAIDFQALVNLGKTHGLKFLKVMQCRSGSSPQNQGIWEGVPLQEVLRLAGKIDKVMRVYWSGFHNNDPKQLFQSSASYTQVADSVPGDLPVVVAYKFNGGPIPLNLGGPVRIVVPWAYGFKSIKWLQRIRLTNDHKAIDTYGGEPDAFLKTQIPRIQGPTSLMAGVATPFTGIAVVGLPGLKRVEYWLRPAAADSDGKLADNDPAWQQADWRSFDVVPPPDDWTPYLPEGISSKELWGFDPQTGKPNIWPLRNTVVSWTLTLNDLKPGDYELRVRTVDLNGYAQPEPRPQESTGRNAIQCKIIKVLA